MALPQPKGKQLEVLDLKPEGHNVVLGTAGSGKTTLAIYRAIYLATLDDKEKVMLVTFNTTLVKYLEAIVGSEIPRNIEVRNYHKFARGYLAHRNKMPRWNGIVSGIEDGDNKKQLFVRRALENVKAANGTNSTLKRAEEVFLEEINWIEKMGIKTLDEYEKVERVGRFDTRIIRENRKYFFQVYKAYLEVRKEEGYLYDWEDIAQTVCEELENDTEKRMYKHIIVDEGQDFSDNAYRLLRALAGEDHANDIFIVGDSHQRIYKNHPTLSKCGINVRGRSSILKINYRTTEEICKYAFALLNGISFDDLDEDIDLGDKCQSLTHGAVPIIKNFKDANEELSFISEEIKKLKDNGVALNDICVVARTKSLLDDYVRQLKGEGINTFVIKRNKNDDRGLMGVRVATMHRVKGLEFKYVFVVAVNNRIVPLPAAINHTDTISEAESITSEKCLLYVALTRAQKGAYITSYGKKSEFLR